MNRHIHLLVFFLCTRLALGQSTYFVATSGKDDQDGKTEATAWRTMRYAASASSPVGAGDTVFIKAGDYGMEEVFVEKNYSPDDARISFIGYRKVPGDIEDFPFEYGDDVDATRMPLLNPGDRTKGEGINISDSYNITFKNIQIANSLGGISIWNSTSIQSHHMLENIFMKDIGWEYSTAIALKEANGNTIRNCLVVNATGAGMDVWGDHNRIVDSRVYSDESLLTADGSYTSMDYYIVLKGDSNLVQRCYAERVGDLEDVGHGFEIKEQGEQNLFVDCKVKNMIGGCFSVRWSQVRRNTFRHCEALGGISDDVSAFMIREGASYNVFDACKAENCAAGIRFLLAGEDADFCGKLNRFTNCIFRNTQWVVDLNPYFYNSAPADSNFIINCTIDSSLYLMNSERPNSANHFTNCIITGVRQLLTGDQPAGFDYSHCDFYDNGFSTPIGDGNISMDPVWSNRDSRDYHLLSRSPCIDAATPDQAPALDYMGTQRPQGNGIDIGAYEYVTTTHLSDPIYLKHYLYCYPNPTATSIRLPEDGVNRPYKLSTRFGNVIQTGIIRSTSMDLSNLIPGEYFLTLKGKGVARIYIVK